MKQRPKQEQAHDRTRSKLATTRPHETRRFENDLAKARHHETTNAFVFFLTSFRLSLHRERTLLRRTLARPSDGTLVKHESREGSHHSTAEDAGRTWQSLRPESNSRMFLHDYSPYIPAQLLLQFLGTKLGTNKTSNPEAQAVSTLDANLPEPNLERAHTHRHRGSSQQCTTQWG